MKNSFHFLVFLLLYLKLEHYKDVISMLNYKCTILKKTKKLKNKLTSMMVYCHILLVMNG